MNKNGKGPHDRGPQTGRKLGYCSGTNKPGRDNNGLEFGFRQGNGCKNRGTFGQRGGKGKGRGCRIGRRD